VAVLALVVEPRLEALEHFWVPLGIRLPALVLQA